MLLGLVLGGMLEDSLRRGLILSRGSFWIFLSDPLTLVLLALSAIIVISALVPSISRSRQVLAEDA
ncbi:hypothetical protein D3C73_1638710 [compost metagenome]